MRIGPVRVMVSVVMVVGACGAAEQPVQHARDAVADAVSADAGPSAVQIGDSWGGLGRGSWAEYLEQFAGVTFLVRLSRPHPQASSSAIYGINVISGGKNVSWVLDGDPASGYWFVADLDHDGDLANDRVWRLVRHGELWTVEITGLPRMTGGPTPRMTIAFDGNRARMYDDYARSGTIRLQGRSLPFSIRCPKDDCTVVPDVRVGFDLDGNGVVDSSVGSYEQYQLHNNTLVAFGHSYQFAIAPDGSWLVLRPAPAAVAARPTLALGSEAPAFDLRDDSARFSLASARGTVVLIDFVSEGCGFCKLDLPWLTSVHDRLAGAGLEVVTIGEGSLSYDHQVWPTIVEPDPLAIGELYRVESFPSYFVVDRNGKLACSHCLHGDVDRVLGQLFASGK